MMGAIISLRSTPTSKRFASPKLVESMIPQFLPKKNNCEIKYPIHYNQRLGLSYFKLERGVILMLSLTFRQRRGQGYVWGKINR